MNSRPSPTMGHHAGPFDIEATGRHQLRIAAGRPEITAADERSRLAVALRRHLRVDAGPEGLTAAVGERRCLHLGPGDSVEVHPLTAFEARFLADNDVPLPAAAAAPAFSPRTDLHSHFAAALPGKTLVALAAEHGITLARACFLDAGIDVAGGDSRGAALPVADLDDAGRGRLAASLDVPVDRQITFPDMERLYARRAPFTRHPRLFVPQLFAIARHLAEGGVVHAELSLSSCLEPVVLAALHAHLDDVERATGVRLRFLVALSRHDDLEWDLDVLDRLEQCLESRAVAGIDIMGHETCSTRAFVPVLQAAAARASARRPLVVRVHAGENPAFPENVREAVTALLPFEHVEARIGHGLYGVDDDMLARMAQHEDRVIVEFNLTSNLALNNIQHTAQVPLRRCLEAGVAVVLGSDGGGMYGTGARDEVRAALACGLEARHGQRLQEVEQRLLLAREVRERALPELSSFPLPAPRAPVHFTAAVQSRVRDAHTARRAAQAAALHAMQATVVEAAPELSGRPLLWIAGAWKHAFAAWSDAEKSHAAAVLAGVVDGVAARNGVLLTGGTHHGVEGIVHGLSAARGAEVVGAIVEDTDPADLDARVRRFWRCARTLYEKAAPVVRFARDENGLCLLVGGGLIVADEQQAAHNLGVRHVVLSGLRGAAVEAVRASRHARMVDSAAQVLAAWDEDARRGRLHHPGPNHAADVVVLRTSRSGERQVLLIRRHDDSDAASGRFALPGGFVQAGETARAAAARELQEETGLVVAAEALLPVGFAEGGGRDPRDTPERWVHSQVFVVHVEHAATVTGGSDAAAALFVAIERCPALAFDHAALLARALVVAREHEGPSPPPV